MGVTRLEHVLVLSDDIDATRDFYADVIGLRDGQRPPLAFPGYWLYAPDGGPSCLHVADRIAYREHAATLGLGDGAGAPETGGGAVDHIAFDADEHDGVRERIAQRGLRAVLNESPGGPRQLFVYDPGGVLVEINVKPKAAA